MLASGGPPVAHAPSHESGGFDSLDLGSIVGVIDDTQHGNRGGGSLHPVVTPDPAGVDGFMDSADKAKLDGIAEGAARVQDYQFGRDTQVPGGGTLVLYGPGNTTVGVRINRAGTIVGAAIQVDAIDGTRSYNLVVYKNGASVATVALPINTLGASANNLVVAVVIGDLITTALVKSAGAGASSFTSEQAIVEIVF